MLSKLALLFLAGGLGTLARYGLGGLVQRWAGGPDAFPWGTFAVNVAGSFLFGVVWIAATERNLLSPETRLVVLAGFMGAFTTFSTFLFEGGQLLQDGQPWLAAANIAGQVVVGLAALFAGFAVGRFF